MATPKPDPEARREALTVAGAKRGPSRPVPFRDQHVLFYAIVICALLSCTSQQKHGCRQVRVDGNARQRSESIFEALASPKAPLEVNLAPTWTRLGSNLDPT